MTHFETFILADAITVEAPDGARVDLLPGLAGGTMARFSLEAGQVSRPMTHRTVEEIWYVIEGRGEMWRKGPEGEAVTPLLPGTALTIPLETAFQFRAAADEGFAAVAITMPPWPGEDEAVPAEGPWRPTFP